MALDNIVEIGIDNQERLYIKPEIEKFTLIYRSATEVHWDNDSKFLFSPKPREWSYTDWYKHIVSVVLDEYRCKLKITSRTNWLNIPADLKREIIDFDKEF
jgi:hypothetical protein